MNNYIYLYLLAISFCFSNNIIHEKVASVPYGNTISIKAFLNSPKSQVHRFTLLYRSKGNSQFIEKDMKLMAKNMYISEIPGSFVIRDEIEYYLLLEFTNGANEYFPSKYNDKKFISIKIDDVLGKSNTSTKIINNYNEFNIEGLEPNVIIISPKPNQEVLKNDLFIALSYFKVKNVDISNIKIFLDDVDVRSESDIDSLYLSIPVDGISPGEHNVRVKLANTYGQKFKDVIWSFTVLPSDQLNANNGLNKNSNFSLNYVGGRADQRSLSYGEMHYSYDIGFDWLTVDLDIVKSSLENKYQQSRDRYIIKLQNDYMNVKLGDSYPNIDQYSWYGHHLRGINIIFEKGPFYLNIVNGKTKRAIQGNPAENSMFIASVDSSSSLFDINISRANYSFEQRAFAAKFKLGFEKNILWDVNYIKVRDNVESVSKNISNAEIEIPSFLVEKIKPGTEGYFFSINDYKIKYNVFKDNYQNIFNDVGNLFVSEKYWEGAKPLDNYILGSNIKFAFDQSKIKVNSGFSLSLFNGNKWNNIENISEFDSLAYDNLTDGFFYGIVALDTSLGISKYKNSYSFSSSGHPLIPFILQNDTLSFSQFMKISSLNKYSNIKLSYLGHRFELGYQENGPDYYSILNPYVRNNYRENYFSDRFNLFQNKLLFFYKTSLITENLYDEDKISLKTKKDLFNLSLYPGSGLPSFNFHFTSFLKSNGLNTLNIISDSVYITEENIEVKIDTLDFRIDLASKQMNISMTNQFNFFGKQYLSFHYYILDQKDLISKRTVQSNGYRSQDASNASYGLSIKSIYNKYLESSIYLNTNMYEYGSSDYDDYIKQKIIEYQFKVVKYSTGFINDIRYGVNYSLGRGSKYLTQYNLNFGINLAPLRKVNINCYIDYRIKYLGTETKSNNDFFFKTNIYYDIR